MTQTINTRNQTMWSILTWANTLGVFQYAHPPRRTFCWWQY